ncbi:MAG TPA: SdpI family protein [Methanotrichaceae archaeon]|nr:SdpI family protein [Methanotrichaceae archaeon]
MKIFALAMMAMLIAFFLIGAYFYPQMPDKIAIHWNVSGSANGYASKPFGIFFMPLLSAALTILFTVIPRIDPLRKNIANFRRYYDIFALMVMGFLLYLYLLTICWNLGSRFNMIQMMSPAFSALFYYAGVMTENARRNWFIGVRTPWTMSSDSVWDKTNRLAGKLMKAAGVLALLALVLPEHALVLILAPAVFAGLYPIIYSYIEYRKEARASNI